MIQYVYIYFNLHASEDTSKNKIYIHKARFMKILYIRECVIKITITQILCLLCQLPVVV